MSRPPDIKDLFYLERIPSSVTKLLLLVYFPIGCAVLILRLFIGFHTFFIACLLRKSISARSAVLRVMCAVLGIVVRSEGKRFRSTQVKMLCANHITVLDHLAVDLVEPCILPSVWDVPALIRWCFGYVDLGARTSRAELIRRARLHVETNTLPLLAFPEGASTNGRVALLKFSPWPCEVSDTIQPVVIQLYRPIFNVSPSALGSSWVADVLWFLFLPFSVYHLKWLEVLRKEEQESAEDFCNRLESNIAEHMGVKTTNFTHADANEAAKRHLHARTVAAPVKKVIDTRMLDDVAMRIKQSYPSSSLLDIRMELERTRDQQSTVEKIKSGQLQVFPRIIGKVPPDPSQWKRLFTERKWTLIEENRKRYLTRLNKLIGGGDQ